MTCEFRDLLKSGPCIGAMCWTLACPASAVAACGQPPGDLGGTWCWVDGAHVRVWWSQGRTTAGEPKATRIRDEVERDLWPLYARLLRRVPLSDRDARVYPSNGGDGRYDIVLTDQPLGDAYGESPLVPTNDPAAPPARFSIVWHRLPDARLRAKVAHELMHGFLTGFRCQGQCRWLEEATATWAEHSAYPTANTEHEYSKDFFTDPTLSLDYNPNDRDRHKFGAYLFLFFLQHRSGRTGGDRNVVRSIWEATERFPNPLAALEASVAGGFSKAWRDFITDNWNGDPAVLTRNGRKVPIYRAWDRLVDGVSLRQAPAPAPGPKAAATYVVDLPSTGSVTIPMTTTHRHLSAAYYVFRFAIGVRSVQLAHNTAGVAGAELVVFTKVGEDWTIQPNWTGTGIRSFCRDRAGDNFEELVVIIGNSSSADLTFSASLTATANSCLPPGAGFQQCQLTFAPRGSRLKDYHNTETQTWEIIPRTGTRCGSTDYQYRWATRGNGSAFNLDHTNWVAHWTLKGDADGCAGIELRGTQTKAFKVTSKAKAAMHVEVGKEILFGQGSPRVTDFDKGREEFGKPAEEAPAMALRFEGVTLDQPLEAAWAPGIPPTMFVPMGTYSCRWSWPGAPPP